MFKELIWLIRKLFTKVKDKSLVYKQMKYFPFKGYLAMQWCGYLVSKEDFSSISKSVVLHENIHIKQAVKYSNKRWIRYYLSYLLQYLKGNPLFHPKIAYYTNPYEMEAYANQHNINYLKQVNKDSYKKYIIKDRVKTYKQHKYNWINYLKSI